MANEFKVKNGIKFPDNTTQTTAGQEILVSGTNIKSINNTSILGSGNLNISRLYDPLGSGNYVEFSNGDELEAFTSSGTIHRLWLQYSGAADSLRGPGGNVVLHGGNYTSFSPSLSGTGATGTWEISVTGTAANITGTAAIANGGTGATTASDARLALLPSVVGNATKVLTVNSGGTDVEWATPSGGGGGITTGKAIAMAMVFG